MPLRLTLCHLSFLLRQLEPDCPIASPFQNSYSMPDLFHS